MEYVLDVNKGALSLKKKEGRKEGTSDRIEKVPYLLQI